LQNNWIERAISLSSGIYVYDWIRREKARLKREEQKKRKKKKK